MSRAVRAFLRGMGSIFDLSGPGVINSDAPKIGPEGFAEDWRNIGIDVCHAIRKMDSEMAHERRQLELELDGE